MSNPDERVSIKGRSTQYSRPEPVQAAGQLAAADSARLGESLQVGAIDPGDCLAFDLINLNWIEFTATAD